MARNSEFFNQMYEYARQAGLSDHLARLAVTQSALETGYGRSVKGNNYFGIKAGRSWNGPVQTFKTWEDVGGKRVNITDRFRKYDDPVQAFKDWEKMIGKRWPDAIAAKDLSSAIDGLRYGQQGGYASDQKYKEKLMSIDRQGQRLYSNAPLFAGPVPIPTPRQPMAMMANAIAADRAALPQVATRQFDQGGILGASPISFNPVSTANAGERPQTKVIRAPVQSGWTPADQASRQAPAKTSTGISFSRVQGPQTLYNRSGGAANDFRPMPSGPIAQSQPTMRDRPMPSGLMTAPQTAPVASPASVAAAYQQYGQTRQAAPQSPMNAQSATSPNINVAASAGTMTTPIQGPLDGQSIQATGAFPVQPAAPTLKQRAMGTLRNAMAPDNLKKAGLTAAGGALGGPVGAAIGGLLGNAMNNPQQGGILSGILSSLGGNGNQSMQSTYIGNGVNAVSQAMYGNRRGDTATYNSQGGGSVTNLGNGESQRTSSKYGWTETTHRDGSKSITYKK